MAKNKIFRRTYNNFEKHVFEQFVLTVIRTHSLCRGSLKEREKKKLTVFPLEKKELLFWITIHEYVI